MQETVSSEPRESLGQAFMPSPPSSRTRVAVKCIVLALLVMLLAECLRIFVGANFYCVVAGKCYRAAQPTPAFLRSVQHTHGIVAILNLRDENEDQTWYQNEKRAAQDLGIKLVNAGLSSSEQPPADDFWKFVHALDTCPEPMLIHCANGTDRTGLASAIYLMLHTDTPIAQARQQLGLRYGHFKWSKAICLHHLLDSYESWLGGKEHTPDRFRTWAQFHFRPQKF